MKAAESPHRPTSLARQYRLWLAALFLAIEAVTVVLMLTLVMWPMAQRSADDLAGLMLLSAQTWAELPPETRPAFEAELARSHQLALKQGVLPPPDAGLQHGFYVWFLEQALEHRVGHPVFLEARMGSDGGTWLWTSVQIAGRPMGVGFAQSRMDTQPLLLLGLVLGIGFVMVALAAWWAARRIASPVAKLDQAASVLAGGTRPDLLTEEGPLELARLARHFNDMAVQVRDLLEARTTLFAGISHDLRTPLARMRLALEMLTLRPGDTSLIDRMERDIEAMNTLIGKLLELARGLDQEAPESVVVADWLNRWLLLHAETVGEAHATVHIECPKELRLTVPTGTLKRILDNLLVNALRYAPGPIDVVVSSSADDEGRALWRVGVLDRGPGIPLPKREAMWQPFVRLEPSRNPGTGGYGLGLAIVRQLARTRGWTVKLQDREGGGLEMWVELGR